MMYPIASDFEPLPGPIAPSQRGPYSTNELSQYLWLQHYHWTFEEQPLELRTPELVSELETRERHLWLWQVVDQLDRVWYLVVGTGLSPFADDDQHCHRWVYAEEAEDEDPVSYFARVAAEFAA